MDAGIAVTHRRLSGRDPGLDKSRQNLESVLYSQWDLIDIHSACDLIDLHSA